MMGRLFRSGNRGRDGGGRDGFDAIAEGAEFGLSAEDSLTIWRRVLAETTTEEAAILRFREVAERARRLGGRLEIEPGKITRLDVEMYGRDPAWDVFATIAPGKLTRVEVEMQRHARRSRRRTTATHELPHYREVMALRQACSADARECADVSPEGALASAFAFPEASATKRDAGTTSLPDAAAASGGQPWLIGADASGIEDATSTEGAAPLATAWRDDEVMALMRGAAPTQGEAGSGWNLDAMASAIDGRSADDISPPEERPLALTSTPVTLPHREPMERFFGTSLADVKVHVGEAAALAPHGARGAAFGDTIAFATDQPEVETLVHELTHVAQHRRAKNENAPGAARPWSVSWDPAETEADGAVHAFMAGASSMQIGSHPAAAVSFDQSAPPKSGFEVHARHPGGYEWRVDEARREGVLRYGGQTWLSVRWNQTDRPTAASLDVAATERFTAGLGPQSHNSGTVTLVVTASFKVTVEIDRAVEQAIATTHQADLVVEHDIQTNGPVMVHATPPPGVQSPWTPVNAQGPQRLLTQYQWAPADVEIPTRSPDEVLLELPPHWIFDAQWKMHAFVQSQGGAWMMWRTSERPTDAAIGEGDPKGAYFIASQLTDAGIASRAETVRGRAAKARLDKLNVQPDDGSILGFKFWDGREVATARELANYYFPIEALAARDPISGEPAECEVFAMVGTQGPNGPYYARTPLTHAAAAQRWRELDNAGSVQGASRGKGLFRSLQVRAAGEHWVSVDEGYFAGKAMFVANLATFQMEVQNLGPLMTSTAMFDMGNGASAYPLPVMVAQDVGGEDMGRWVKAQVFRPDPDPQFLAAILENGNVANNVQDLSDTEVINTGQRLVNEALVVGIAKLSQVADSTDTLRGLVMQMPLLAESDREEAFQFLGLESQRMLLGGIFGKREHAAAFALGNDVGGFTLVQLQAQVAAHRDEIVKFQQRVTSWEFEVVRVDGEIGEWARKLAYQQLGFGMRAEGFPHRDKTSGVFPEAMAGDRSRFKSVGEQMWANKSTHLADDQVLTLVLEVSAVVVGTVVLLLVANVAGGAIAGALFESGTFAFAAAETVGSAFVFTGLDMAVHGDLDPSDPAGTAKKFGKAWAYNTATFAAFNALGAGLGALSKVAVKSVVGPEVFAASRSAQAIAEGLRITGIGASFVAINIAAFEAEHGRLPRGPEEYIEVVYSALLSVALLEAGAVLSRPFTEAISGWQRARSVAELARDIDVFQGKATALTEEVAKFAKGGEPPPELVERQIALLKEQAKLVGRIRDKMRGTDDEEQSIEWAQKELGTIGDAIATLKDSQFLTGARIKPTADSEVFTYESGTGALEQIRDYYGKSNVDDPDAQGVIHVRDGARTLEFTPKQTDTGSSTSQRPEPRDPTELLKEMVGSGKVQAGQGGDYTADAADLTGLRKLLAEQAHGGSVSPIHYDPAKGESHFEIHVKGGERIKVTAQVAPRILTVNDLVAGKNQPVGTPLKSRGVAEDVMRGIVHGELGVLSKVGLDVPEGTELPAATEFGIGKTAHGEYVIVRGENGAVDWERLPGLEPVAHTHPSVKENDLRPDDPTRRPDRFDPKTNAPRIALVDLVTQTDTPMIDREVVFPSAQDIGLMARLRVKAHRVLTSFIVRDGFVMKPEAGDSSARLEIVIEKSMKVGEIPSAGQGADLTVYRTTLVGEIDGNVVVRRDVWATEGAPEDAHLYMNAPDGMVPAKAPTARPSIGTGLRPGETLETVRSRFEQEAGPALGKLAKPPTIQVMYADEFVERFESESGRATFRPDGAGGIIYARPDAQPYAIREEVAHAKQHDGPMGAEIRRLDSVLQEGNWKDLSVRDRVEAFRRKLDIEIDAQQQRLKDPDSAAEGDTDRIHETLAELKRLKQEVEKFSDREIAEMSAGIRSVPQYLETPAELFSKVKDRSKRPDRAAATRPDAELVVLPTDGPERSAAYNTLPNVRSISRAGHEWTETTRVSSDQSGIATIHGDPASGQTIVVRTTAGNEYSYPLEPGAKVTIADGAEVAPGTELAVEPGRRYRQVKIEFEDGTSDVREEIRRVDGDGFIQRGSENTRRGSIMEDAARLQVDARLKAQGVEGPRHIDHHRGGGGFDDVIVIFSGPPNKPTVTIRIREVKGLAHRHVPLEEFSAIRPPGLGENLRVLDAMVVEAITALKDGSPVAESFEGMTKEELLAISDAIAANDIQIEIVLGPSTKLGAEHAKGASVLRDLRREIKAERGKDILARDTERIEAEYVNEAVAAEADKASTDGSGGGTPPTPTSGSGQGTATADAALRAEVANEVGSIPVAEKIAGIVPLGASMAPLRSQTYYIAEGDATRMVSALRRLTEVQVHDYGIGIVVKRGGTDWYFERLSQAAFDDYLLALQSVARADPATVSPDAAQAGAELGLPPPNAATVELWEFRGIRDIDGRKKDEWTAEEKASVREETAEFPLLEAGHVGISFDGGKTIYGFQPDAPGAKLAEIKENLYKHLKIYPGKVEDDTDVFRRADTLANERGWNTRPQRVDELVDPDQKRAIMGEVTRLHAGGAAEYGYAFPLKQPVDGQHFEGSPDYPATSVFNCAVFPSKLGLPIPEPSGNMVSYDPAFQEWVRAPRPVDARTPDTADQGRQP